MRTARLLSSLLLVACGATSDDPGGNDPGIDLGHREAGAATAAGGDAGASANDDAGAGGANGDAGAGVGVNGCVTWVDRTSGNRTVEGPDDAAPGPYAPSCIQIRKGQSVTFESGGVAYFDYFADHPLEPFGGDPGTPILATRVGESAIFVFPNAGVYGFRCAKHPDVMKGAVRVSP